MTTQPVLPVAEVVIRNVYNGGELANLEKYFASLRGVTGVHIDRTASVAHLSYDTKLTTLEAIREVSRRGGYDCGCRQREGSSVQQGQPRVGNEAHAVVASSYFECCELKL